MNLPQEADRAADPLAALRAATGARHARLDSGLAIGAPEATLADYIAHLRLLRAWLAPLQAWLATFDDGPRYTYAPRLAAIDDDLRDAGVVHVAADTPSAGWPVDASGAYRWGVCYVVEGAQLGGAVLYQRLAGRLAPHPLRLLRGEDGGPGPGWRVFMQALRAHVRTEAEVLDACAGACAAFDRILALAGR